MSTRDNSPSNNVQPPRCPHCGVDLPITATYQWTKQLGMGIAVIFAIYCPEVECRKVLGTQILIVPHAQEESPIVGPH